MSQMCYGDDLTLYFFPSPNGIDWTSPRSLAQSTISNYISLDRRDKPHPIGHVITEMNCSTGYAVAGMSTAKGNREEMDLLFKQKIGLGILLHNFEGAFDDQQKIMEEVNKKYRTGHVSYLRIFVQPSTCTRALAYFKEYGDLGYQHNYGLINRPRHREGAGCSAFATSILEIAGLLEQDFIENWHYDLVVPKYLVGGPATGKKISFWRIYFLRSSYNQWDAPNSQEGYRISFYDPDSMHRWLVKTWKREKANPSGFYITEKKQKSYGLIIDRTLVPTPTESFWLDSPVEQILN